MDGLFPRFDASFCWPVASLSTLWALYAAIRIGRHSLVVRLVGTVTFISGCVFLGIVHLHHGIRYERDEEAMLYAVEAHLLLLLVLLMGVSSCMANRGASPTRK